MWWPYWISWSWSFRPKYDITKVQLDETKEFIGLSYRTQARGYLEDHGWYNKITPRHEWRPHGSCIPEALFSQPSHPSMV